jgi:hypothetical protein
LGRSLEVSDSLSNVNEQIDAAARAIGRSRIRRKVFEAIYHHKKKIKTASELVKSTGLRRIRVLQEAGYLSRKGITHQHKQDGEIGYEKIDFIHAHKKSILAHAGNNEKLAKLPTKRKAVVIHTKSVTIPASRGVAKRISIDDVASFSKVKRIRAVDFMPSSISETQFKRGVQKIVGEKGEFKDWGGEKSDLYTTRIYVGAKRLAAAFAFKGPGLKTKLVPGRMGKNGDQAQRLFQEEADVFLVQHWREIDPTVITLMQSLAVAKSVMTGRKILFGIIDGIDSERLRLAYPNQFK